MPASTAATQRQISIPTIDISPFLSDPKSFASKEVVTTIAEACEETGFFQITGHGISSSLQDRLFKGSNKFFSLPFETKNALDAKKNPGMRGYDVLASQSYIPGVLPDLKEGFYIGADFSPSDPSVLSKRFFSGPNVWPAPELLPRDEFRDPAEEYHAALLKLSGTIMQIVAAALPYSGVEEIFEKFVDNPVAPLRLLHYPPGIATSPDGSSVEEKSRKQFGSSAHTDFGAITLLLQDEHPGLQIQDPNGSGEWIPVPPQEGAYVVNVGDMLSMWTGNKYKSSMHRVVNESVDDRYSIVFFLDGNLDVELSPLDGEKSKEGRATTVEEHMYKRIGESYGKKA